MTLGKNGGVSFVDDDVLSSISDDHPISSLRDKFNIFKLLQFEKVLTIASIPLEPLNIYIYIYIYHDTESE